MIPKVSIIVPTCNEAENIDLLLERIFAVEGLHPYELEVIFSDGASSDDTCCRVTAWTKRDRRVRLIPNAADEGLSAAVMAGARAASGEFVVVMDADLSHPPERLPDLLSPLVSGQCDMVIGSRYVTGGDTPDWPYARRLSSHIATIPARFFTDVKDPLAGFFGVRRERLAILNRKVCGFKIGLELLATSEETFRVKEVPILFRDRMFGASKMGLRVMLDYIRQLFMLAGVQWLPENGMRLLPLLLTVLITDASLMTMLVEYDLHAADAQILSLLAASMVGGGWLLYRYREEVSKLSHKRLAGYLAGYLSVQLLTAFLRSGLVGQLVHGQGGLGTAGILYIAVAGLVSSYAGSVCYVFSIGRKRLRKNLILRFYALGVFAYLMLLRLVFLGALPPLAEEIEYAQELVRLLGSWNPVGGQEVAATTGSVLSIVIPMRLAIWLLWIASCLCMFSLGRFMYDRDVAFMTSLLFGVLPIYFISGVLLSASSLVIFFWSWALYMLYRALVNETSSGWVWAGAAIGLGVQVSVHLLALLAAIIVFLLVNEDERRRLFSRHPVHAMAAMLCTFIPTLIFWPEKAMGEAYITGWLDHRFQQATGGTILLVVALLLSPSGLLAGGYALYRWLSVSTLEKSRLTLRRERTRRFVIIMLCVPLALFMLPRLFIGAPVALSGVGWLVLLPSMATTVNLRFAEDENRLCRVLQALWWPTIGMLLLGYGVSLHLAVS